MQQEFNSLILILRGKSEWNTPDTREHRDNTSKASSVSLLAKPASEGKKNCNLLSTSNLKRFKIWSFFSARMMLQVESHHATLIHAWNYLKHYNKLPSDCGYKVCLKHRQILHLDSSSSPKKTQYTNFPIPEKSWNPKHLWSQPFQIQDASLAGEKSSLDTKKIINLKTYTVRLVQPHAPKCTAWCPDPRMQC